MSSLFQGAGDCLDGFFGSPSELISEANLDMKALPYPEVVGTRAPSQLRDFAGWCDWAYKVNTNTAFQMYQRHPEWGQWPGSIGRIPLRIWMTKIPTI